MPASGKVLALKVTPHREGFQQDSFWSSLPAQSGLYFQRILQISLRRAFAAGSCPN
jgi:hypothetical protein